MHGWPRSLVRVDLALAIRFAFVAAAVLWSLLDGTARVVLSWAALVVVLDVAATALFTASRSDLIRNTGFGLLVLAAVGAALASGMIGASAAPLIMVPAYHFGLEAGLRAVPAICGTGAAVILVPDWLELIDTPLTPSGQYAWIAVSISMALLGTFSYQLSRGERIAEVYAAREASALLTRLHELADDLGTGFDVPALGESVLSQLRGVVDFERSAVIIDEGDDNPVPVALSGSTRLPWRAPGRPDSALHTSWTTLEPHTATYPGPAGIRHVLTVALTRPGEDRLGMIVADRLGTPFRAEELAAMAEIGRRAAPVLDAALLFADLRGRAAIEERGRLARDMHDGICQDIAALALSVDVLHTNANEAAVRTGLDELRTTMRRSMADLRHHISDLRMAERPDTTIGSIMSRALQHFATTTGIETSMTLSETHYRFPADIELNLHRLTMDFLNDARLAPDTTRVDWTVAISPPHASIVLRHDGRTSLTTARLDGHPLSRQGATISTSLPASGGLLVTITMGLAVGASAGDAAEAVACDH